jgi:glycosyltransferase involved in cell wall biosynthesis
MKVLFVCTVPTDKSGIPNVIFNLLNSFDSSRYEIGYISINEPSDFYKEKLKKINSKLFIIPRKITSPLKYISKLAKVAKEYDIMHVHGNSATMVLEMIAAKIAGVNIRIAHSHNTTCKLKSIDTIARPLFYRLCNGRLACGVEAGKWLFNKKDFKVINNGIDVNKFRYSISDRKSIRTGLGIDKEYVIGHIGNFVDQKNHSFLIDIFQSLYRLKPNSILLLLGDGPLKSSIQSKVRDLGLSANVIFAGSVNDPEKYMNAMDVVVMPSLFEGLPLTIIEEQANGLSIVVADSITNDANLTGKVHYVSLCAPVYNWATIIQSIIEHNTHNEISSDKAISQIQKAGYDINMVVEDLKSYYNSFIK